MKKLKLTLAALVIIGAFSCKKTNSNVAATGTVTTDQAADIAAGSLALNSEGLATVSDDVSANALTLNSVNGGLKVNTIEKHQECGTTVSDSVSRVSTSDSVSINYFFKYNHTLNCNSNNQPDNMVNVLTYHGSFDGPNVTSTNTGSSTFTIAGLTTTATNFVINGEYKRAGTFQSKVGNKVSGNSTIDIVVTNLTLTKPARKIASGNATISITGTSPKGTFSYTGNIVFNGDNSATLTINNNAYTIDLRTGFKVRR